MYKLAKENNQIIERDYHLIRLPEEPWALKNYIHDATYLEVNRGRLIKIKLMRIKFKYEKEILPPGPFPPRTPGRHLVMEFELHRYPMHWCRVFKRIRVDPDIPKLLVKDWEIIVF